MSTLEKPVALPATGYVRLAQLVPAIIPFSPATLWRRVKAGEFPQPVKLSPGVTAWRVEEIRTWLSATSGGASVRSDAAEAAEHLVSEKLVGDIAQARVPRTGRSPNTHAQTELTRAVGQLASAINAELELQAPKCVNPAPYVTITLASTITGLTEKAIRRKIEEGEWLEGREYRRAPDGAIFISIKGYAA